MEVEKDIVMGELKKGLKLKWKERCLLNSFSKLFIKIYRKGMIDCFKYYNK